MNTPPQVLGQTLTKQAPVVAPQAVTPAPATQVLGETVSRGSTLPVTGGDIAGLSLIGLAAIGMGTMIVRRARSRRAN